MTKPRPSFQNAVDFTGNDASQTSINALQNSAIMLTTLNSPYIVEPSENTLKAVAHAVTFGLLNLQKSNAEKIQKFLSNNGTLPIFVIEAACLLNSKELELPLKLQNLWLCLDNTILCRTQLSGREFRTRVSFPSVYVNSDKAKNLLSDCEQVIGYKKICALAGLRPNESTFRHWKTGRAPIPLVAVIKAAEILNVDHLEVLDGCELLGKTSQKGKILFKKQQTAEIVDCTPDSCA